MHLESVKQEIVEIAHQMWLRGHANTTGVAISVRVDDGSILVDPSGTGFRRCGLTTDEIIVIDEKCELIEGPKSRRAPVNTVIHAEFYRRFPLAKACVHCHPVYSGVFACLGRTIEPFTLQSKLIGSVPCVMVNDSEAKDEYYRLEDPETVKVPSGLMQRPEVFYVMDRAAKEATSLIRDRADELRRHGLAFTLFEHGIFVFGRNLGEAFDNLERVECNARTILFAQLLK